MEIYFLIIIIILFNNLNNKLHTIIRKLKKARRGAMEAQLEISVFDTFHTDQ